MTKQYSKIGKSSLNSHNLFSKSLSVKFDKRLVYKSYYILVYIENIFEFQLEYYNFIMNFLLKYENVN